MTRCVRSNFEVRGLIDDRQQIQSPMGVLTGKVRGEKNLSLWKFVDCGLCCKGVKVMASQSFSFVVKRHANFEEDSDSCVHKGHLIGGDTGLCERL